MRTLTESELLLHVERDLLPDLADECISEFYLKHRVILDGSPASLEVLDRILQEQEIAEPEALVSAVGAYLALVLSRTDGARWAARFDRGAGADGYRASRLRLYTDEVDVFTVAAEALCRKQSLSAAFHRLHRPLTLRSVDPIASGQLDLAASTPAVPSSSLPNE